MVLSPNALLPLAATASGLEALAAAATAILMLVALLGGLELYERTRSQRESRNSIRLTRRDR